MSQYKVLPPYSDISTLSPEYEEASSFAHFSLIYSPGSEREETEMEQGGSLQENIQNMQILEEVQTPILERTSYFPWEQEGVRHLQEALNSQPPVSAFTQQSPAQPVPYAALWDAIKHPDLASQDTLDLSTTSNIPSYTSYSPSPSRLTILHPRNLVMSHPLSGQSLSLTESTGPAHHDQPGVDSLHIKPVTSLREMQEEKRTRTKNVDGDEDRPCRVCREKAGKHSYYGGQVCPSCRAFFRRSVQSGYNATYYCVKDGECEVNLKTRKNCQFCRYKLCEAAGMKTSWVLTEEERKLKFQGKGKRKRSSSSEQGGFQDEVVKVSTHDVLTDTDFAQISTYVAASDHWETSKVNDMDTELIRKIIRMIAFRATLDETGKEHLKALMIKRADKFANKLTEFLSLCPSDKSQILTHNLPLVVMLSTCSMFSSHLLWTTQMSPLLGAGEVDKLDSKLRTLNVKGLDSLQMTYRQFFNGRVFNTEEDENRFSELVAEIGNWKQDETECVLMSLVLLFSPDMLDLSNRKMVEEHQLKFAILLQKYLKYKHPHDTCLARSRFTSGMMIVSKCKDMKRMEKEIFE